MKSKVKNVLRYLKAALSRMVGRTIEAAWTEESEALGYTMHGNVVYVAENHEVYDGLSESEKTAIQIGVGTHEGLHQMFTDFGALDEYLKQIVPKKDQPHSAIEVNVLGSVNNILEDAYIEQEAQSEIGGTPLKCLNYSIERVYNLAKPINEAPDALSQYMAALINYGDMGEIKGSFTYPEALEVFNKTSELFSEGIYEENAFRRAHLSYLIFKASEPLWSMYKMREIEAMKQMLEKMLGGALMPMPCSSDSSGSGMSIPIPGELAEQMKSELSEMSGSSGGKSGDSPTSTSKTDSDSASESKSGKDEDKDGCDGEDGKGKSSEDDKDEDEKPKTGDGTSDASLRKKTGDWTAPERDMSDREKMDESGIAEEIEEAMSALDTGDKPATGKSIKSLHYDGNDSKYCPREYTCLNRDMSTHPGSHAEYLELRRPVEAGIKSVSKALDNIFKMQEEAMWKTRGKFNVPRYSLGTTARYYGKKYETRSELACMILIDESGSMRFGNKYQNARSAAILIAEACHKSKIPCYVMGFEADTCGYDVVHNHYVGWNINESLDPLCQIHGGVENHDDFSIRTAGKILAARGETNKILFVISDGEPACRAYSNGEIKDPDGAVINAIKGIQHKGITVFGVGIQGISKATLEKYYGKYSAFCEDSTKLGSVMSKQLLKLVKDNS